MSNKKYYIENPFLHVAVISAAIISFLFFDKPIAAFFYTHHIPFVSILTHLGTFWLYLIPLGLVILVYKFILKNSVFSKKLCFLWLNIAIPCLSCLVLKMCLGRARPVLWFSKNIYGFYGPSFNELYWSFPSGHTTTIISLTMGLSYFFPKKTKILLIIGIIIAGSRVLLVQHYLSDVLIAAYLVLISQYLIKDLDFI